MRNIFVKYALPHTDYVFVARATTACCSFADLKHDVIYALKKINKNFIANNSTVSDQILAEENESC